MKFNGRRLFVLALFLFTFLDARANQMTLEKRVTTKNFRALVAEYYKYTKSQNTPMSLIKKKSILEEAIHKLGFSQIYVHSEGTPKNRLTLYLPMERGTSFKFFF
jgi:hypothetical protein